MNLKEVKQRIQSVKNTQKITSVMKLISASKLHRAQSRTEGVQLYEQKLNDIFVAFIANNTDVIKPYVRLSKPRNVAVIAVSSNSALCGAFNANVIRVAKDVIDEYTALGVGSIELYAVGKMINDSLRKAGYSPSEELMLQATVPEYSTVAQVAYSLMQRFVAGEIDRIELVYTRFVSVSKQVPVRETLLPLDVASYHREENNGNYSDYIIEPSIPRLLEQLLPKVIAMRLFTALLDSVTAEHAARMLAMQVATDNADELVTTLVREYNKSRQQAITNELLDIVSGSVE